jgi:hypothetical protein
MTLLELAETLPNGLHDSQVTELLLSYVDRSIRLRVNVWVGHTDGPAKSRETYRAAVIVLRDFEYCVMDRPDAAYPFRTSRELTIDATNADPSVDPGGHGSACRLRVGEWNGFIHIRAGEATLTWTGESRLPSE